MEKKKTIKKKKGLVQEDILEKEVDALHNYFKKRERFNSIEIRVILDTYILWLNAEETIRYSKLT